MDADNANISPSNWTFTPDKKKNQLCPGYCHVESFDENEIEYEEEEEEVFYVTLDMGDLHPTVFSTCQGYRIAGLDTEHPFIQLNDAIFMGEHQELLGSEVILEEGRDELDHARKFVRPVGLASQRVQFKEVFVQPDEEGEDNRADDDTQLKGNEGESSRRGRRGRGRGRERGRGTGRDGGQPTTATGKKRGRPRKKRSPDPEVSANAEPSN